MNTIKNLKFLILAAISMLVINSCVQDDDFSLPPINCGGAEANLTLAQLQEMIDQVTPETTVEGATEKIIKFDQDYIIEGYIVSSDSTGNFFKTISVQNSISNPTIGIQIEMDRTNLFNNFPLGAKVKVALTGLYAGYDRSLLKIGDAYNSGGEVRVGRMADNKIGDHVAITCDPAVNITPVTFPDIASAMESGVINSLIKIENVQFAQTGITYGDAANQTTVNRDLVGATAETNNQTIILRNSGFADFANVIVPEGSGSITAVLSKFNNDWQLFIRDTNDVQFNNPRFGNGGTGEGDGPIGGDNAEFEACINEGFNAFDPDDDEFGSYINDAAIGTRYWEVKEFGGNKYIQMSSFNSNDESNTTYFIVPVNFSDADKFSFKTKDGYNNGNVLSIYYSTDYTLGGSVANATLTDITSSFNISTGNVNGYGDTFIDSNEFDLSSISGNGAIIFKYEGSGNGVTTTMQIDDIKVVDNENPDCGNGGGDPGDDPTPPSADAAFAFPGADFENWATFEAGLNSFGIQNYATQGAGTGMNGTASLHIATTPTTTDGNDYVFTALPYDDLPSTYTKIDFFMKGTADKSVSLNVYKTDGSYYTFNLGTISSSQIISVAENNQYTGTVNTGGEWIQVSLDLSGITDLNTTDSSVNFFALKIGKNANYDLHFDNFTIE